MINQTVGKSRSASKLTSRPEEMDYLSRRDRALGDAIKRIGPVSVDLNPDLFSALLESIVWQQLSGKAASTIYQRLLDRVGTPDARHLYDTGPDALRACGLSTRKAASIYEISRRVLAHEFDFQAVTSLPDDEVVRHLTQLPGVGVWTAEMLLIFSLARPNIFSWGDLGIRNGVMKLHRRTSLTREQFDRYARKYAPYGTIASLYMWQIAN
ncbi:MAG: DNA-3-methyladenine glycosylase 2 family protein [Planctomycetia bacterium]|nr:DNA-3-methyladenine glycosylase 2 family protein [Planctomycetia bacterium]